GSCWLVEYRDGLDELRAIERGEAREGAPAIDAAAVEGLDARVLEEAQGLGHVRDRLERVDRRQDELPARVGEQRDVPALREVAIAAGEVDHRRLRILGA